MNILVTGASGFVGSHVVNELLKAGHEVTCCVRNVSYTRKLFPKTKIILCDFTKDISSAIWLPRLKEIDVVINTVGIFYHPIKKIIWQTHFDVPKALFDACVEAKIKKILQISALNVDQYEVDYAKSKLAADEYLLTLPLISIILRPSLIYGVGSYGSSSLFRGLAGLPFMIPLPNKGKQMLQPIHLADFSAAMMVLINKSFTQSIILNAVCAEVVSLKNIIINLRQWLTFSKAVIFTLPKIFILIASYLGNVIPNSVINNFSFNMLSKNNVSSDVETKKFIHTIQFVPRNFHEGLFSQISTVQDKWHAQLYFVKPVLQLSLAFLWIFTAICSVVWYPLADSYQLLKTVGVNVFWQPILLYSAALLDFLIGLALICNVYIKQICLLQFLIISIYTIIITVKLPQFWFHPFGPLTKNVSILISIYIFYILQKNK